MERNGPRTETSSNMKQILETRTSESNMFPASATSMEIEVKRYECDICDYKAGFACDLKTHIREHTVDKPFETDTPTNMEQISETCTSESSMFPACPTAVEIEIKRYECDICDYKAAFACDLKTHIKKHTGDIPFKTETPSNSEQFSEMCNTESMFPEFSMTMPIEPKQYESDKCSYKASFACDLKTLIREHTGNVPIKTETPSNSEQFLGTYTSESRMFPVPAEVKRYECNICDYKAAYACDLKTHIRKHTGDKPFKCNMCDYESARASHLKTHMSKHTGDKPHKCTVCDYKTAVASHLKRHMNTHAEEKQHACEMCEYRTANPANLKLHYKQTHTEEKRFKCTLCDYQSTYASRLKQHALTHTGHKPFKCVMCEYQTTKSICLKRHIKTQHTEENKYECVICTHQFPQECELKRHMSLHTGEPPHRCELCEFMTYQQTQEEEKVFECNFCEYKSIESGNLKRHLKIHTGDKPHECDICDYKCAEKHSLKIHIRRKHTGEKPYKCDMCEFRSVKSSNLKAHKYKHTGERPYSCDICGSKFKLRNTLRQHLRIHTGEKPYSCNMCDYKSAQPSTLKQHLRTHMASTSYFHEEEVTHSTVVMSNEGV